MGSETNFFVAIPYNGQTELTSYTHDRMIRRLRTGELSTHTHTQREGPRLSRARKQKVYRDRNPSMWTSRANS